MIKSRNISGQCNPINTANNQGSMGHCSVGGRFLGGKLRRSFLKSFRMINAGVILVLFPQRYISEEIFRRYLTECVSKMNVVIFQNQLVGGFNPVER